MGNVKNLVETELMESKVMIESYNDDANQLEKSLAIRDAGNLN
jgi:hypothetical protein